MFDRILVPHWISLKKEIRVHLVKVFNLTATGIAEIRDQSVISDGYSNSDLDKITAAKMAEYVGSNESFPRLWELTLAKVHYELHPPLDFSKPQPTPTAPTLLVKDKDGNELLKVPAGSTLEVKAVEEVKPEPTVEAPAPIEIKSDKFCISCDSKGVRHKKDCPTQVK